MDFYINKGATLPILKMELINDGRNDYDKFNQMIQNASITFCMTDIENGVRKIGKKDAICLLKDVDPDCNEEYYIGYKWSGRDTNKVGTYVGQFTISFDDNIGTLIVPIKEELFIHVLDGSIKK